LAAARENIDEALFYRYKSRQNLRNSTTTGSRNDENLSFSCFFFQVNPAPRETYAAENIWCQDDFRHVHCGRQQGLW